MLLMKGTESIGWRLATQESTTSFLFTEETKFSSFVLPRNAESKSKYQRLQLDLTLTVTFLQNVFCFELFLLKLCLSF